MSNYTCEKETEIVYKLRVQDDGIHSWANITIREWPRGGSIDIQSDHGNYSNSWMNVGDKPFRHFLCRLDMGYFFNKCLGNSYLEFDCEATIREIRMDLLASRRAGDIEKDIAREIWESLEEVHANSAQGLILEMGESSFSVMVNELHGGDCIDLPDITRPKPDCVNFWKKIWPCACEVWRNELAKEPQPCQS